MFTGLIETVGRVHAVTAQAAHEGHLLTLDISCAADLPPAEAVLGESVAVDGVCLTVTQRAADRFSVEVSHETQRLTTLGSLEPGRAVNLERALKAGARLGGHLVSGHVDALGTVAARRRVGQVLELDVAASPGLLRYVVMKGSIAIDGTSLTVNGVDAHGFSVTLIPHTSSRTTLADKEVGAEVNLEADLVVKSVERLVAPALAALMAEPRHWMGQ